jgi:hypothetical protein
MNYEDLKSTGVRFYEKDFRDGGIYLWTREYWLVNNNVYFHDVHPNLNRYTGHTDTYFYDTADGFVESDGAMDALQKTLQG